jgi:pSer/pThr/pTyr-binding forkhead associated (FHA) protein
MSQQPRLADPGSAPPLPKSAADVQAILHAERGGTPFLVYRDAAGAQIVCPLDDHERWTIGRNPTSDVVLDWDPSVSRTHAVLERLGDAWTLSDDGLSRNGTYLNAERLAARRRLVDRDAIRLGETLVQFRDPGSGALAATSTRTPTLDIALTPMQRKVLVALCRPMVGGRIATPATNAEIADELVLSVDAVKTHLRALFDRFGVNQLPQIQKRTKLVELALHGAIVTERDV